MSPPLSVYIPEIHEYCQWEKFNATCRPDEVILMESSRYGRMRFGRCMKEDHGSVGCAADVLPHVDRICSGRHNCEMTIPDATLHNIHPCPKELMPYLEAKYSCVKGELYVLLPSLSGCGVGKKLLSSATVPGLAEKRLDIMSSF